MQPRLTAANNTPGDATNPLNGTVFYYAIYDGSLTDGEISTNATALLADDDSYTPTVSVTPDGLGSPVLRQAGTDLDKVVKTTVFLQDMGHFKVMNEVYGGYFGDQPPARSTVEVAQLPLGALVEIEAIALIR